MSIKVIKDWVTEMFSRHSNFSKSSHMEYEGMTMYIKVQFENIRGETKRCIVLDSLLINNDSRRGKGIFTRFLQEMESLARTLKCPIIFNSVINKRLEQFLINISYKKQLDIPNQEVYSYYHKF